MHKYRLTHSERATLVEAVLVDNETAKVLRNHEGRDQSHEGGGGILYSDVQKRGAWYSVECKLLFLLQQNDEFLGTIAELLREIATLRASRVAAPP